MFLELFTRNVANFDRIRKYLTQNAPKLNLCAQNFNYYAQNLKYLSQNHQQFHQNQKHFIRNLEQDGK